MMEAALLRANAVVWSGLRATPGFAWAQQQVGSIIRGCEARCPFGFAQLASRLHPCIIPEASEARCTPLPVDSTEFCYVRACANREVLFSVGHILSGTHVVHRHFHPLCTGGASHTASITYFTISCSLAICRLCGQTTCRIFLTNSFFQTGSNNCVRQTVLDVQGGHAWAGTVLATTITA